MRLDEEEIRTRNDRDDLEGLVDRRGLKTVLDDLATICGEKAEHLRVNWQDGISARAWDRAAKRIESIVIE